MVRGTDFAKGEGMVSPRPLVLFVLLLASACFLRAGESQDRAMVLEAQRQLGEEFRSWPIEVRNSRKASVYPRTTHALVFEWRGGLWFYCPADGTQSLSRFRNQVDEDRVNLLPLLQRIEPGFAEVRERPDETPVKTSDAATANVAAAAAATAAPSSRLAAGNLRNGCFIESLVFARSLSSALPRALSADIVSYYSDLGGKRYGHSVVWFTTAEGDFVYDSHLEPRVQPVQLRGERTPLAFARRVADASMRGTVAKSIALPVEVAQVDATVLAADNRRDATDSETRTVIR